MNKKRIAVTGIGASCSLGNTLEEIWKNLIVGSTGVIRKEFIINKTLVGSFHLHAIENLKMNDIGLDKNKINEINIWKKGKKSKDLNLIIYAIANALEDAGLKGREGVALIVTHENPGLEDLLNLMFVESFNYKKRNKVFNFNEYFGTIYSKISRSAYETQSFMFLHHIAKLFNIHNFSLFINNACATGLYAIELGAQLIRNKVSDVVVIAASDSPQIHKCLWLKERGLYSENGSTKAFARGRDGFIFGESGCAIILEGFERAKNRGTKIYSEYLSGGFSLESWKVTLPNVAENYYRNCLNVALQKSKVSKEKIDIICPHGLGTISGDKFEAKIINEVFDDSNPIVTAFKPLVGHALGASALIETILLLLVLEQKRLPKYVHANHIEKRLNLEFARKETMLREETYAVKTSYGFGGFDAAIVLRSC